MALAFNDLDQEVRQAWFRVVLRGQPVEEHALGAGVTVEEVQGLVDQAREAMGLPEGAGRPWPTTRPSRSRPRAPPRGAALVADLHSGRA